MTRYTKSMSIFVQPTIATLPKKQIDWSLCLIQAGIIILIAVAQLFTFEKFPDVTTSLHLPMSQNFASILPSLIVTFEVFSLPSLLIMNISPLMRALSMLFNWLIAGIWLFIALWTTFTVNAITNVGLLGASVKLPAGWWFILFSLTFTLLVIYTCYVLWPFRRLSR
jgi:hypothetical protein